MKLDVATVAELAGHLELLDQRTGKLAPFALSEEQREVLDAIATHQRVVVLKGRQQGISTICCLVDLVHAIAHPGQRVAIVADTQPKASGLLAKCAAWARSMGIPLDTDNVLSLALPNGSHIDAVTAVAPAVGKDSKTGRSFSYGHIHASELAFWANDASTMAALTSTALPCARVVIESTASAAENLYRWIWHGTDAEGHAIPDEWERVFLSVERHAAYVADPASITDERWAELRGAYGFTSRPHAAWWAAKLTTDMRGDIHKMLREYPVRPDQAFSFAEGRWIHAFSPITAERLNGAWRIYVEKPTRPVVFGVDTSAGTGGDNSAIAVMCQASGQTIATWTSNVASIPDFIAAIDAGRAAWKPVATVVESNGVGAGVFQSLNRKLPGIVVEQVSEKAEKAIRFANLRVDIETGVIGAGPELVREVRGSVVDREGVFDGPDDLLNATSFANEWRRAHPWRAPVVPVDPQRIYVADKAKKRRSLV